MANTNLDLVLSVKDQASKQLQDTSKKIGRSFDDIAKKAQGVGIAMTAAGGLVVAGAKKAVDASSNLGESINAVSVIFGDASDELLKFGETAAQSAGLSQRAFNQAAVPIGAQLKNMGFATEEAADQTIALTQRAADLASVFNTDVDQALNAIGSGLRGESEPLKQFGVGLTQAAVQAYALENGLAASKSEIDANVKAQATLGVIMEQTNQVQGDFVNTSDSLANSQRIAAAEAENMSATVGQALQPILEQVNAILVPVLQKINEWMQANPELSSTIVKIVAAIGALMVVLGPILVVLPGIITAFGMLSTAAGVVAGAIGAISLPVVAVIAAIAALIAIGVAVWKNWDKIKEAAGVVWSAIQDIIGSAFDWIQGAWESFSTFFTEGFNLWLQNVLAGWELLKSGIMFVWNSITAFIKATWETIKKVVSVPFNFIKDLIINGLNGILENWKNTFQSMKDVFSNIFENGIKPVMQGAIDWIMSMWDRIAGIVGKVGDAAKGIGSLVGRVFGGRNSTGNRAIGGFAAAGRAITVGEKGPEMFVPSVNGKIVPNGRMGGNNIVVNITGNNISSKVDMDELATRVGNQIVRNLNNAYSV